MYAEFNAMMNALAVLGTACSNLQAYFQAAERPIGEIEILVFMERELIRLQDELLRSTQSDLDRLKAYRDSEAELKAKLIAL